MMSAMIAMREVAWIPYCKQELDGENRGFNVLKTLQKSFMEDTKVGIMDK